VIAVGIARDCPQRSLEIARAEPRLFDELLDWMLVNEHLLSVRRLRAMCIDETDRALTEATVTWLGRQRPRQRLLGKASTSPPATLEPLFRPEGPMRETDESFVLAGFLRPPLAPSHKSGHPDPKAPIDLAFRLRQILGVGIRAEVVRILLTVNAPRLTAQVLARSTGYSKRNVHEALAGLNAAGVVSTVTVGGEQRYAADHPAWAALLHTAPTGLATHRDWPQLLGALRSVLRWSQQPGLAASSDYLLGSRIRDLLETIRPELAFAGIPVSISSSKGGIWRNLANAVECLLAALGDAPKARP
jgi:hypothetical protein